MEWVENGVEDHGLCSDSEGYIGIKQGVLCSPLLCPARGGLAVCLSVCPPHLKVLPLGSSVVAISFSAG